MDTNTHLAGRLAVAGKLAVIVGAGGGLGRAAALELAAAGVDLALCDRNAELLTATVAQARQGGVAVTDAVFDARDADVLRSFIDGAAKGNGGRVDILVNVVGGTFHQPFAESTPKGWDALIRTNFTWLLHAVHAAIPHMRNAGGGSIISLSSIEGHRAAPGFAVYAGMKAAVVNFTRTIAVELAPENIRANTIACDMIPTEGMPTGVTEEQARVAIPMGRMGNAGDFGGCVLFLASHLSRYVTGTSLHPDGGAMASAGWFNWPESGFRNYPAD